MLSQVYFFKSCRKKIFFCCKNTSFDVYKVTFIKQYYSLRQDYL